MDKIFTSLEQSKKLLELGIERDYGDIPAWSLSALNDYFIFETSWHNDPLDAAIEMVCWLKEDMDFSKRLEDFRKAMEE